MPKKQIDKTITALAGEFLVAGQLCLRGYLASLTLKNYPEVDIFVLNPENGEQTTIQVKTIRSTAKNGQYKQYDAYFLPEELKTSAPYFIFVYLRSNEPEYFIIPTKDVEDISSKLRDNYLESHPNANKKQQRMLSITDILGYKNNWESIKLE